MIEKQLSHPAVRLLPWPSTAKRCMVAWFTQGGGRCFYSLVAAAFAFGFQCIHDALSGVDVLQADEMVAAQAGSETLVPHALLEQAACRMGGGWASQPAPHGSEVNCG